MKKAWILLWLTAFLTSCATVQFYKDEALTQKTGLRVHTAKPYILVAKTNAKDRPVEISVVFLPDLAHPVYVKQIPGFGSSELKVTMANGVLTSFGTSFDPAVAETLEALSSLVGSGAEVIGKLMMVPRTGEAPEGPFELYEVGVENGAIILKKVMIR
jgi:hypothetical protein